MLNLGLKKTKQETAAPQIISFHRTPRREKHKHRTPKGLRSPQHRKLRFCSPLHGSKKDINTATPQIPMSPSYSEPFNFVRQTSTLWYKTGFVQVLESPGILFWHFPGLESPGKKPLVLESSGNLLNLTKCSKCRLSNLLVYGGQFTSSTHQLIKPNYLVKKHEVHGGQ